MQELACLYMTYVDSVMQLTGRSVVLFISIEVCMKMWCNVALKTKYCMGMTSDSNAQLCTAAASLEPMVAPCSTDIIGVE